ncbi:OmpA family protein [Stenotrophomonas sp. STM01]|jgi:OOP family OmpA-OmpF porin|uniref:OmpA family protein n=1 Tax=unclassified Stenotrophomonas TaxID=196198 RepID=UPI00177A984D|nr:OmpA family protein [Stenotrophomonas sp. STM01]MBD9537529.1 OmpA family protein [Stenotrophomonas sp. STM01]
MRHGIATLTCLSLLLAACGRTPPAAPASGDAAPTAGAPAPAAAPAAEGLTAGSIEFPVIPPIMVPSIIGSGPAQKQLEASMQALINPIDGITVRPANCATDGGLVNESGFTNVDAQGNLQRVSGQGVFEIGADGSGHAVTGDDVVEVAPDGSGSIINSAGTFEVQADGSGTYVGAYGNIELDGKGGGNWVGEFGNIENHGDGSGRWVGAEGSIEINADGSGKWIGGPEGIVENRGDGTGTVGAVAREVRMAPLPPLPPAGRFPLLDKFKPSGAPCGFVITLNDQVLFDFDKADIRPDAGKVLDTLATALGTVQASSLEVRGHTDAKGSDDYNQDLSERRARSVVAALQQRGAAAGASAHGYGETQPVAPNEINGKDNPGGRQLNRRVEIFVRT